VLHRFLPTVIGPIVVLGLVLGMPRQPTIAAPADTGYRDFQFGASCNSTPTGEKPESKLWWNDGFWWNDGCC
jgi:hypothetical protein